MPGNPPSAAGSSPELPANALPPAWQAAPQAAAAPGSADGLLNEAELSGLIEAEAILAGFDGVETLGPDESDRVHQRLVAPPCRPLPIQLLSAAGSPCSDWFYADILDMSVGGLCLLITGSNALEMGQGVVLDFKDHPGSKLQRLNGVVRWFVRAENVTTLGVGFSEPLRELPQLQAERRTRLRDLNGNE